MPVITGVLSAEGAVVRIEVGWSRSRAKALRQALRPVPPPQALRAIIDSGADVTCVDSKMIQQLGLPRRRLTTINAPATGGLTFGFEYDASLRLVHPTGDPSQDLLLSDWYVLELDLGLVGYQALIGRDVLALCDFNYRGRAGAFELNY